jgi:acetolactate synthase-1/2/3 large subunit
MPVYLSGMGRGLLGSSHPLQMRHKRAQALAKADFVLLAGVPADFRLDYGRSINAKAYFATVNLCKVTLTKNNDTRMPNLRVHGDACVFLQRLSEMIGIQGNPSKRKEWKDFLDSNEAKREREIDAMLKADARPESEDDNKNFIGPLRLCREIDAVIGEDSFIVADGGDFVGSASYTVKPRVPLSWLDPGVFGTLGVGGGFALGAKLVRPESEVWILFGDGASGYSLVEFDTYVRMGVPVIAVIGNDACWSQMYRDQIRLLKDPVATQLAFTSYEKVAEGFGAKGIVVRRESQVRAALLKAKELAKQGHPVLVNCLISRSAFREGSISL